ncbi:hypothetical protein JCM24511_00002 [Saitozyma sp. JCM 24511]|nr:hypothetical protein JCM24511_00002 [Saitozyma sp. JCM 24511]
MSGSATSLFRGLWSRNSTNTDTEATVRQIHLDHEFGFARVELKISARRSPIIVNIKKNEANLNRYPVLDALVRDSAVHTSSLILTPQPSLDHPSAFSAYPGLRLFNSKPSLPLSMSPPQSQGSGSSSQVPPTDLPVFAPSSINAPLPIRRYWRSSSPTLPLRSFASLDPSSGDDLSAPSDLYTPSPASRLDLSDLPSSFLSPDSLQPPADSILALMEHSAPLVSQESDSATTLPLAPRLTSPVPPVSSASNTPRAPRIPHFRSVSPTSPALLVTPLLGSVSPLVDLSPAAANILQPATKSDALVDRLAARMVSLGGSPALSAKSLAQGSPTPSLSDLAVASSPSAFESSLQADPAQADSTLESAPIVTALEDRWTDSAQAGSTLEPSTAADPPLPASASIAIPTIAPLPEATVIPSLLSEMTALPLSSPEPSARQEQTTPRRSTRKRGSSPSLKTPPSSGKKRRFTLGPRPSPSSPSFDSAAKRSVGARTARGKKATIPSPGLTIRIPSLGEAGGSNWAGSAVSAPEASVSGEGLVEPPPSPLGKLSPDPLRREANPELRRRKDLVPEDQARLKQKGHRHTADRYAFLERIGSHEFVGDDRCVSCRQPGRRCFFPPHDRVRRKCDGCDASLCSHSGVPAGKAVRESLGSLPKLLAEVVNQASRSRVAIRQHHPIPAVMGPTLALGRAVVAALRDAGMTDAADQLEEQILQWDEA